MKPLYYSVSLICLVILIPSVSVAASHSGGTNVISGQQVYHVQEGGCGTPPPDPSYCAATLRPYPSAEVFLSYPQNSWGNIVQATADDLALSKGPLMTFAPGTLVNDRGTIYIISGLGIQLWNEKRGFPSAAVFLSLGYQWSNVITADTSFMNKVGEVVSPAQAHPAGTLVNEKGTIYYITPVGKISIVSMEEFNNYGFNLKNVVTANIYDETLPPDAWSRYLPQ